MVCIGAVADAHGVRGDVKIKPFTAKPKDVAAYGPVLDVDGMRAFDISLVGEVKGAVVARLAGVSSRDGAEALKGLRLHVPRERLPNVDEDEFYHADLIGLAAVSADGQDMGIVNALYDFGAGDLIEIRQLSGELILLPFTREAVPVIDLVAGFVSVDAAMLADAEMSPAKDDSR